jgi:hypothetical protein
MYADRTVVVMKGAERAPRCRFRALHVFLLLLAVLMVAGVAGCAGAPEAAGPLPERGTETGLLAPELAGTRSGGEGYRLEPDHADATVVVFYRGAYCGLCRERLRQLEAHLPDTRAPARGSLPPPRTARRKGGG